MPVSRRTGRQKQSAMASYASEKLEEDTKVRLKLDGSFFWMHEVKFEWPVHIWPQRKKEPPPGAHSTNENDEEDEEEDDDDDDDDDDSDDTESDEEEREPGSAPEG